VLNFLELIYSFSLQIENFYGADLNDQGDVLGLFQGEPAVWREGEFRLLPTGNFADCRAVAINEKGDAVGWGIGPGDQVHALWWTAGELVDLGPGMALDLNDDGHIVGSTGDQSTSFNYTPLGFKTVKPRKTLFVEEMDKAAHAARWQDGRRVWTGPPNSQLRAINKSGVAVGGEGLQPIISYPSGEIEHLLIPDPYPRAIVNAISDDGTVGGFAKFDLIEDDAPEYLYDAEHNGENEATEVVVVWSEGVPRILMGYDHFSGTGMIGFDATGLVLFTTGNIHELPPGWRPGAFLCRGTFTRPLDSLDLSERLSPLNGNWTGVDTIAISRGGRILLQKGDQVRTTAPSAEAYETVRLQWVEFEERLSNNKPGYRLREGFHADMLGWELDPPGTH